MNQRTFMLLVGLLFAVVGCVSDQTHPTPVEENWCETLKKSDGRELTRALHKLREKPAEAHECQFVLRELLNHDIPEVRSQAALVIAYTGAGAVESIPSLVCNTKANSREVRISAALALGSVGEAAKCAIPDIAELLWADDPYLRGTAAAALASITNKELVSKHASIARTLDLEAVSGLPDIPEGEITSLAKKWWKAEGKYQTWGNCLKE